MAQIPMRRRWSADEAAFSLCVALIGAAFIATHADTLKPNIDGSRIIREGTNSSQLKLIDSSTDYESKSRLVMARFSRKLVINTPKNKNVLWFFGRIPFSFQNSRVIIGSKTLMSDNLSCKNSYASIFLNRAISIFVANDVFNASCGNTKWQYRSRGFWSNEECWKVTSVFYRKSEGTA